MTDLSSFPAIQVSHLPSAASFYAAITQSLGLQYLSSSASPSPTCLYFGYIDPTSNKPITSFALTHASLSGPPQKSLIRLSAPSPAAVETFYKKALLANNVQKLDAFERKSDEEAKARIEDLDGNMLEAVYSSRAGRRIPTMETASTEGEARRVLAWQEEVARSTVASEVHSITASPYAGDRRPPPSVRRADTFPALEQARPMRLVRRDTITTEHYSNDRERAAAEGRGGAGNGHGLMKGMGVLLGAAAGAAVAYAMVRSESPPQIAPSLPRRASYGDHGYQRPVEEERIPARSYVSARDGPPPRYLEYRVAPPPAPSRALAQDIARLEERSHVSHRSRDERGSRARSRSRSRSEVGSTRYATPLADRPIRERSPSPLSSHVSRRSHNSGGHHSKRDTESYVSARSHRSERSERSQRSESTVTPVQYISTSPSKITTTTIRMIPKDERRSEVSYARHVPLPTSEVSARHVPLPRSMASGRGYAASVAPSDSVSSVGSKRERERLRERMGERGQW